LLTVLRYIEANPLRAKIVRRAEDYRWSSYRAHGLGDTDELLDRLAFYEQLSPYAVVRRRLWAKKVHLPLEEPTLAAIRRSSATGLPYGADGWVQSLSKKLHLDLTIRPRGRPRKTEDDR
jgi:putative transposase